MADSGDAAFQVRSATLKRGESLCQAFFQIYQIYLAVNYIFLFNDEGLQAAF